jgi:hypothetical protein
MFESDIGRYPTDNEGFNALIECPADLPNPSKWKGPYIKKIPLDPWIHPYKYVCSSKFDIISAGPDGKEGTADDIQAKDKYVNRGTEFGYSVSMGPPIWLVYLTLVLLLAASVASAIRKASWITIAFGCAVALCLLSSLAVKLAIHGIQFDDTQRKQAILQTMANASSWVDTVAYLLAAAGAIGLIFKNRTKAGSSESLSSNEVK